MKACVASAGGVLQHHRLKANRTIAIITANMATGRLRAVCC